MTRQRTTRKSDATREATRKKRDATRKKRCDTHLLHAADEVALEGRAVVVLAGTSAADGCGGSGGCSGISDLLLVVGAAEHGARDGAHGAVGDSGASAEGHACRMKRYRRSEVIEEVKFAIGCTPAFCGVAEHATGMTIQPREWTRHVVAPAPFLQEQLLVTHPP